MRVNVDQERCQGHTLCAMTAPDVFELSEEDGHASVIQPEVEPEEEAAVRDAVEGCPERAITIHD